MPPGPRAALSSLALSVAVAGPAAGFTQGALTEDPLRRGAALALPSVYRIEARYELDGLRLGNGTVLPLPPGPSRVIREVGTGFAVSPDGVIATAAHVAAPDGAALARAAAPVALLPRHGQRLPGADYVAQWVALNDVVPIRPRLTELRVSQAVPDPASPRVDLRAAIIPGTRSAVDDLVLLRVPRRGIPALELDESMTVRTPVATIGFGAKDPLSRGAEGPAVPEVRLGRLGQTGSVATVPGQRFTTVTVPVERGDSGGPAVDAEGRVHGVVRWRYRGGGILVQASRLRILLRENGIGPGTGASATAYRSGLDRLWRADLDGAARDLREARAAYPQHALAGVELARVERLRAEGATVRAEGWGRGLLLALASGFLLAAGACIAAAMLRRPARPVPGGTPRGPRPRRARS